MTITMTDIGILLILIGVLLWAIMAALHRHTVMLESIRNQLAGLTQASPLVIEDAPPISDPSSAQRASVEIARASAARRADTESASLPL